MLIANHGLVQMVHARPILGRRLATEMRMAVSMTRLLSVLMVPVHLWLGEFVAMMRMAVPTTFRLPVEVIPTRAR